MTDTVIIDPLAPIALLDVADTLNNEYWVWCADDVMDADGEMLDDDSLTYDDFEFGPGYILEPGTVVKMPYLWGYGEGGMTAPADYQITVPKAASLERVVHVILSAYYAAQEEMSAGGRFYFIENVSVAEDGSFEIVWGT